MPHWGQDGCRTSVQANCEFRFLGRDQDQNWRGNVKGRHMWSSQAEEKITKQGKRKREVDERSPLNYNDVLTWYVSAHVRSSMAKNKSYNNWALLDFSFIYQCKIQFRALCLKRDVPQQSFLEENVVFFAIVHISWDPAMIVVWYEKSYCIG